MQTSHVHRHIHACQVWQNQWLQDSHLSAGICGTRVAVSQQLFIKKMVWVNSVVLMGSLEYALDATS